MGIDTDVLLRVRDRKALREAFEARAARERQRWADDGREADYEALLRDGYDPMPLIRPLDDGSALIFTGLRFHDDDMEFSIRCWLAEHFGDMLARVHDDPRGVFTVPDICEPKARTYDGVIEELGRAGRFIHPAPPTDEEHEQRARALEEFSAGMDSVRAAAASGDPAALEVALASAPDSVRKSWRAQNAFASGLGRIEPVSFGVSDANAHPVDLSVAKRVLELMGISTKGDADDGPLDESLLASMFDSFLSEHEAEARADPFGFGRVSMLLPSHVAKRITTLPGDEWGQLDVQERIDLADGSAIVVTSRVGENVMEAMTLAEVLEAAGVDRAAIGPLPFFRESLAEELARAQSFDDARSILGERAEMLTPRTSDEYFADERAKVGAWLERDS